MRYLPTGQPMEVKGSWWTIWSSWLTWRDWQSSLGTWTSAWTRVPTVSSPQLSVTLASSNLWLAPLTQLVEGLTMSTSAILILSWPVSSWRPTHPTIAITMAFVWAWRQRFWIHHSEHELMFFLPGLHLKQWSQTGQVLAQTPQNQWMLYTSSWPKS